YKLDLLTLLISLFILSSCQQIDGIGLDVDPNTDISGGFTDTLSIRTYTVKDDSIVTNSLTQYPLGYLNDPVFGKTYANMASSITSHQAVYSFGNAPVLDSAVLVLYYGDSFFGDSTSYFRINVPQLSGKLLPQGYYNTTPHLFYDTPVGSIFGR